MRVLRRAAAADRAGLRPARAPRLDGASRSRRRSAYGPRAARAGRHGDHERPVPERRPPERHQPDLAGAPRRRAARLRREPRAPRRRRRRRAGVDRRVPRGLPGGRDHPAGQARRRRARSWRTSSGCSWRRSARSTRRRATSAPRSRRTRPACGACGRSSTGTAATRPRDDGRAARLHRAAHARRARRAAARRLRGRGSVDTTATPTSPSAAGRASRSRRTASASTSPAATRSGARRSTRPTRRRSRPARTSLKCLIDPDLPVNDGFYRLISVDAPAGHRRRTAPGPARSSAAGRPTTRLTDVMFRALLPAFPERLPAGTKGMMCQAGFGSLDVAAGKYVCFYDTFAGGYGGRSASDGPDAVQAHGPEHRERADRGDRAQLPGADPDARARRGLRRAGPLPRRPRAPQGLPLRPPRRPSPILADRDKAGPRGAFGGHDGREGRVRPRPRRRRDAARLEDDRRARAGRRDQRPHLRRRRLRAARGARPRAGAARRARGKVSAGARATCTAWPIVDGGVDDGATGELRRSA